MYDYYRPFDITCPDCGQVITGWQGMQGPNLMFVWQQDSPHPIDHDIDPPHRLPADEWPRFRLPAVFLLAAQHGDLTVTATGVADDGTWRRTHLHHALDYGCPRSRRDG